MYVNVILKSEFQFFIDNKNSVMSVVISVFVKKMLSLLGILLLNVCLQDLINLLNAACSSFSHNLTIPSIVICLNVM